jgi:hypothetical protein
MTEVPFAAKPIIGYIVEIYYIIPYLWTSAEMEVTSGIEKSNLGMGYPALAIQGSLETERRKKKTHT